MEHKNKKPIFCLLDNIRANDKSVFLYAVSILWFP